LIILGNQIKAETIVEKDTHLNLSLFVNTLNIKLKANDLKIIISERTERINGRRNLLYIKDQSCKKN